MDFVVAGHTYRARKMDAKTQFKITKKIAPLVGAGFIEAMEIFETARTMKVEVVDPETGKVTVLTGLAAFFATPWVEIAAKIGPPLTVAYSKIADDDLDFIIAACLSLTERFVGQNKSWAPVWNEVANRAMFDDINYSMPIQVQIIWAVLREPMANFFSAAPSSTNDGASSQTTIQ